MGGFLATYFLNKEVKLEENDIHNIALEIESWNNRHVPSVDLYVRHIQPDGGYKREVSKNVA